MAYPRQGGSAAYFNLLEPVLPIQRGDVGVLQGSCGNAIRGTLTVDFSNSVRSAANAVVPIKSLRFRDWRASVATFLTSLARMGGSPTENQFKGSESVLFDLGQRRVAIFRIINPDELLREGGRAWRASPGMS
jgi:hypothetical protein